MKRPQQFIASLSIFGSLQLILLYVRNEILPPRQVVNGIESVEQVIEDTCVYHVIHFLLPTTVSADLGGACDE